MQRFVEDAIVLSTVDYGEADRIVTLFTRGRGRLSAFAAGARKSKRRFAGALEPGTRLRAQLVERRGDTFRLDGADVQAAFHHLRDELALIARALYALELCRELTQDHQPHEALFADLTDYLQALHDKRAGPTSLLKFELDALEHAGFRPSFTPCVLCGGPLSGRCAFDPSHGGVVCDRCFGRVPNALGITPELSLALAGLQDGQRTPLEPVLRAQARRLLNAFVAHHLGRRLKAVEFMETVGTD